jgi:hypothetical protein
MLHATFNQLTDAISRCNPYLSELTAFYNKEVVNYCMFCDDNNKNINWNSVTSIIILFLWH